VVADRADLVAEDPGDVLSMRSGLCRTGDAVET